MTIIRRKKVDLFLATIRQLRCVFGKHPLLMQDDPRPPRELFSRLEALIFPGLMAVTYARELQYIGATGLKWIKRTCRITSTTFPWRSYSHLCVCVATMNVRYTNEFHKESATYGPFTPTYAAHPYYLYY